MTPPDDFTPSCPLPQSGFDRITMAHGGGGQLSADLIEKLFLPAFGNPALNRRHDGGVFEIGSVRLAMTTDGYVVQPLVFPGGDIGTLAINGTVNDLAMCGARPLYMSAAFTLEEGLPMETLAAIAESMRQSAAEAGVQLVAGDTKVVERGKVDGLFICTSGVGLIEHDLQIHPGSVRPGDAIVLSGDIGRHGMAVMALREGLEFENPIESDCACLAAMVGDLLADGLEIHCLRDLTRGGLASALVEIATTAALGITVEETEIPVIEPVRGACEMLGLDPLYVANEGRMIAILPAAQAERAAAIMGAHPVGEGSRIIGRVSGEGPVGGQARVVMRSVLGTERMVVMMSGEQLPRIC